MCEWKNYAWYKLDIICVHFVSESPSFLSTQQSATISEFMGRVLKPKLRMPYFLLLLGFVFLCACNVQQHQQQTKRLYYAWIMLLLLKRNITNLSWRRGEFLPSTPIHNRAIQFRTYVYVCIHALWCSYVAILFIPTYLV